MLRPFAPSLRCTLAALAMLAAISPAGAQQVVAIVNGEPITAVDIVQRTRLIQISTHKTADRQTVLNELIDEKLKLQIAKRYKLDITDTEVDNAFNGIAHRARSTPAALAQSLTAAGVSPDMLKARIRADMAWSQIIRGKFQSKFQIREKDVIEQVETRKKPDQAAYEYTLRPILFIVPRGSPATVFAARSKEAEALRGRFQGCEEGLAFARSLRDVTVRDPITRSSADLAASLRELLDKTVIGRLTPPEQTTQGVEVFAVCSKKEIAGGETPARREVRDEMLQERFVDQGKRYLRELRKSAMIEYK